MSNLKQERWKNTAAQYANNIMAIWVVKLPKEAYKIRQTFGQKTTYRLEAYFRFYRLLMKGKFDIY